MLHSLSKHEQRRALVRHASEVFRVPMREVMSRAHLRSAAYARWYAAILMRSQFGDSYPKLGQYFNRDHSTLIHGMAVFFGHPISQRDGRGKTIDTALHLFAHDFKLLAEAAYRREDQIKSFLATPVQPETRHVSRV